MYDNARIHFIAVALLSLAAFITTPAEAKFLGAKRVFCTTCCSRATLDGTNLVGECTDTCNGNICLSNTLGEFTDTYPLINALDAEGTGLNLSLHFNGENANGEKASLDTGIGFGWSHSYNTLLFTQDRDVFKMSPGGTVTKYQRSGRTGPLKAITGTQQDIVQNADGSIEITNRQGGMKFRFEKIPANPVRVAGMAPWMLKSITDRNNKKTELTYQNGLLHRVTDAFGRQIKFEYDASKHLSKITDPLGRVTQLKYGGYNDLTKIIDPLGNAVHYQYDVRHQIVKKTEKNGNQWQYKYDASGHPIEVIDHAGQSVLKLSNPVNWATNSSDLTVQKLRTYIPSVTTLTDGRGNQWQYFYNADGQITKKVAPDNATTTYTYDPSTLNMASMTDANGHTTLYEYDGFGNLAKQIVANGNEVRYEYDNPFNYVSQVAYFASGALTSHSVTRYEYDAFGNRIKQTRDVGGLELQTDWTYYVSGAPEPGNPSGLRGLVKTEELHNGAIFQITRYEYDAFGNRTKVTNPEGHVTLYEYDILGNRIKMTDGNGHEWVYAYDALDRLTQEIDPLGYATRYAYDGNGNRIRAQKQVTQSPDNFQTTEYQYDYRNRLIKETRDPDGLNLETASVYDNNDNRIKVIDPRGKATDFAYDAQNRLSKVTDALTNVTENRYDPVGNRTCTINANAHYTFFEYDALNRLTKESKKIGAQECTTGDADDIITQNFYDSGADIPPALCLNPQCGAPTPGSSNVTRTIDPEGKYTYFKYDRADRRVMTIRKVGDTDDDFDRSGNPSDDDWSEIVQYDDAGNVTARTDANGNTSTFSYFVNNWLKTEANALAETTAYTYDGVGNVKTLLSSGGNLTTNHYNARNELIQVGDSEGPVAGSDPASKPGFVYDGVGNLIKQCDGNDHCTQYAYDAVNRLIAVTDALGETTDYAYDKAGNLTRTTDREQNSVCYLYDDINRRTLTAQLVGGGINCALLDANDIWTKTHYDPVGNVISLTTAKHGSTPAQCNGATPPEDCEATTYVYDEVNRLVQETYPEHDKPGEGPTKNSREYSYDKAGNLKRRIDQKNQITDYAYNDLYYLVLRDYQTGPDDSLVYDLGGRMTDALCDGWQVTFQYDAANRVLHTSQDGKAVSYSYDIPNRCRTLTYPGGKVVTECRDFRERLADIDAGAIVSYLYDFGNRVQNRSYGNGTAATYSYNDNNWITKLEHTKAGPTLIAGFGHDYDKEGNKRYEEKQHELNRSEAYHYDDLYRLIDYKVGDLDFAAGTVLLPLTQTQYNLDKLGNWDSKTKDGATETREHNAVNEITKIDLADIISDDNGNLIHDPKYNYEYDQENRLTKVSFIGALGSETAGEYRYDALSRRIIKKAGVNRGNKETHYFYDDARIIEEHDPSSNPEAFYVYGNYIDEILTMDRNGQTYYYHQNTLWSVAAITDATANVVERVTYDAYGHPTIKDALGNVLTNSWGTAHSAIGNPWLFTGRQYNEEAGLYYYRARYYDPDKGRFLQRDPLGYMDGMNMYLFVSSNPISRLDPLGLQTQCCERECEGFLWQETVEGSMAMVGWKYGCAQKGGTFSSKKNENLWELTCYRKCEPKKNGTGCIMPECECRLSPFLQEFRRGVKPKKIQRCFCVGFVEVANNKFIHTPLEDLEEEIEFILDTLNQMKQPVEIDYLVSVDKNHAKATGFRFERVIFKPRAWLLDWPNRPIRPMEVVATVQHRISQPDDVVLRVLPTNWSWK